MAGMTERRTAQDFNLVKLDERHISIDFCGDEVPLTSGDFPVGIVITRERAVMLRHLLGEILDPFGGSPWEA